MFVAVRHYFVQKTWFFFLNIIQQILNFSARYQPQLTKIFPLSKLKLNCKLNSMICLKLEKCKKWTFYSNIGIQTHFYLSVNHEQRVEKPCVLLKVVAFEKFQLVLQPLLSDTLRWIGKSDGFALSFVGQRKIIYRQKRVSINFRTMI